MTRLAVAFLALLFLTGVTSAQQPSVWHDPSPHTVQFVKVDEDVKLEVLDWGGPGRSVVLLAGLGNTAHVFDDFAPKLTRQYHVYGITRRGYGASSTPSSGYEADRLGDDVLAVLDALKLDRPVLVGHSIAGEELSSVGTRHPERVSGLVYLDAAYSYAYYDSTHGDFALDLKDLRKKLEQLASGMGPQDREVLFKELLQQLPAFERDVRVQQEILLAAPTQPMSPPNPSAADLASLEAFQLWQTRTQGVTFPEGELRFFMEIKPDGSVGTVRLKRSISLAIAAGMQKYTDIRVPTLAIYAIPHDPGPSADPSAAARAESDLIDTTVFRPQVKAFEDGVPSARVVVLPNASHYIFLSNEEGALREIRAFLGSLR